jgi:hypothetical protein
MSTSGIVDRLAKELGCDGARLSQGGRCIRQELAA